MEFGPIPALNEFQINSARKFEVVNEIDPSKKIDNDAEPKEVLAVQKDKIEEFKKSEVKKGDFSTYNEVTLTNLSFGYNDESKDFFIKVKRGDFEAQYPTDEMMRLKAFILSANEKEIEAS
ncbi:flagellin [Arcobacter sp.]|uniref:flagellin n=1 Tax=Arcobacter sp. TaxID=1872629 RepID=UPI003D14B30E